MRKVLLAAAGLAVIAGVAGFAMAQDNGGTPPREHRGFIMQSDANNDGVLTRQEFDAGRDAMFARQDANNDGQLTREEMRAGSEGHERSGRWGGRGRGGMHSFEHADANNDGNITREEFLARPTEHFNRIDANHDGVISASERPQRPERADGERRGDRPRLDADGDRQISRSEFATMGASMFDRFDANNDGHVTREEADAARPHRHGQ